eukprot:CAMPEP_0116101416 /NCGR_PEP_ID=MMETSP0327-20121206/12800_1 /TAXON_ID=44447 /ORGANISM="Pseudo-nitzschia delicatissima, Strain B596" /LENGTH=134 /DNA_ID=CAMNT_0003593379 /DNA_START=110 /DNA_END=514 /DNA_ORIENTATION=-
MPSATGFAAPEASKEIPVLAYDGGSPPEYAMIEVNGNLVPPVEFPPEDTCVQVFGKDRTVELGKLYRNGPEKTPMMILGNHQLTGEVVKLKDSFCLMEKKYDESVTPKKIEAYQIIGMVTEKFLFKNYPKAIMR